MISKSSLMPSTVVGLVYVYFNVPEEIYYAFKITARKEFISISTSGINIGLRKLLRPG